MQAGTRLGHFEIVEPLGAGGMGEVYRAHDTSLKREVAIKVLPEAVAADPERLGRLEREAHLLASLNHVNIASIHSLERDADTRFLVLELVEGETLAERLKRSSLPVMEALEVARQIAEALEAAHEKGIIHRDLKPANVMLTPGGRIKVLDFGLAKAFEVHASAGDIGESPTLTVAGTQTGIILGTAPYMSPEQVRGRPLDKRVDIWAFGCIVYELLTASRAFARETVADTLAAIIGSEPNWGALPAATPAVVLALVKRCLRNDPERRLHDIADARIEIEEAMSGLPASDAAAHIPTPHSTHGAMPWLVAGCLMGALIGVTATAWITRNGDSAASLRAGHLSVNLAEGTTLDLADHPAMAVSPNGLTTAWAALGSDGVKRLYVRDLDHPEARLIEGTENAYGPFFSPDGRWIAYFDQNERQIEKVTSDGAVLTKICDAPISSKGATWSDRGEIIFSRGHDGGLARVSADGGAIEVLTEPDRNAGVKTHRFPASLPGGRAVLFMIGDAEIATYNESRIAVLNLDTGEQKILVEGGMSPRYAASGHLIFARRGTLMAAPFDPTRLELLGPPVRVLDGLVTNGESGYGQYALAQNGTLLYAPGGPETYSGRMVQADRAGRVEPLSIPERVYHTHNHSSTFAYSPDGRQLAITVAGANSEIWLWSRERQVLSRLTHGWANESPIWSPDGERLIFMSDRRARNASDFLWIAADGSGQAQLLYETDRAAWPSAWSPDGQFLAYIELDPETGYDVWSLPIGENMTPGTPKKLADSSAREIHPRFSPDSAWLAYSSDETGVQEIYVRSLREQGPRQQVSSGGGVSPRWGPRGDEILFVDPTSSRMMRATVSTAPEFSVRAPDALFDFESTVPEFVLSPDGEHFVFLQAGSQAKPIRHLRIVLNWLENVKQQVPRGR